MDHVNPQVSGWAFCRTAIPSPPFRRTAVPSPFCRTAASSAGAQYCFSRHEPSLVLHNNITRSSLLHKTQVFSQKATEGSKAFLCQSGSGCRRVATGAPWRAATRKSAPLTTARHGHEIPRSPFGFPLEPLLVLAILKNIVQGQTCCNCGLVIHSSNHELVRTISSQLQYILVTASRLETSQLVLQRISWQSNHCRVFFAFD